MAQPSFDPFRIQDHASVVWWKRPFNWTPTGYGLFAIWILMTVVAFALARRADFATLNDPAFREAMAVHKSKADAVYGAPAMGVLGLIVTLVRTVVPNFGLFESRRTLNWPAWTKSEAFRVTIVSAWFAVMLMITFAATSRLMHASALLQ